MHTNTFIKINKRNQNLELISKLMNSVAVKYDCRIRYNDESGNLDFQGDHALKKHIAEETISIFGYALT